MRVGIYGRILKEEHIIFVQQLIDELIANDMPLLIYHKYLKNIKDLIKLPEQSGSFNLEGNLSEKIDILITLGGDGTFLDTINIVKASGVNVLGINMGRLGFLATINKNNIKEAIGLLKNDQLKTDDRSVLEVYANKPLFEKENFALNEFTIYKRDAASMITVHTFINDEFLTSYWADGVIVATPTGSTAYSLSCGGPIIEPSSANFVITPIAPHNLNVRPFVVNDNAILRFEIESRNTQLQCSLDSRSLEIDSTYTITVKKADFKLHTLKTLDNSFLQTLRDKLFWGKDGRYENKLKVSG